MGTASLPWRDWPWQRRCPARWRDPTRQQGGRCELRREHPGELHALERGMYVLRFTDPIVTVDPPVGEG
jgi:hypothetical protein